ncbi:hypothetical protein LTS10_006784 [Elasticomyces elasticus]|nr:hypothetical protein LTS10_006784 [Elasticomyces elasticus]
MKKSGGLVEMVYSGDIVAQALRRTYEASEDDATLVSDGSTTVSTFLPAWLAHDTKDTRSRFPEVRHMLEHYRTCEVALAEAFNGNARTPRDIVLDSESAKAIRATMLQLQLLFLRTACASSFADTVQKDLASSQCSVVLSIPELAEDILIHVGIDDILSVMEASKSLSAIVRDSPKLQHHMGVRADGMRGAGYFRIPLQSRRPPMRRPNVLEPSQLPRIAEYQSSHTFGCTYLGPQIWKLAFDTYLYVHEWGQPYTPWGSFYIPTPTEEAEMRNMVEVTSFIPVDKNGELATIGSRYRTMLVCQPPISRMEVCIAYAHGWFRRHEVSSASVRATSAGLTLGDLWDTAKSLMSTFVLPSGPAEDAAMRGSPFDGRKITINFRGTVQLRDDDPIIVASRDWEAEVKAAVESPTMCKSITQAYYRAKYTAHDRDVTKEDVKAQRLMDIQATSSAMTSTS